MKIINNENRKLVTELVTPVAPAYHSDILCCSQILFTIVCPLDFINKKIQICHAFAIDFTWPYSWQKGSIISF